MNVWVIGRNYPFPENSMQGSFEIEQAKMIARYGNNVCYLACCLHLTKRIKKRGIQYWKDDRIEVNTLSALFLPRIYPFYMIKLRNRLWKRLLNDVERRNGMPDVIHVHYPAMLMITDVLKEYKEKGVRIVATEHWTKVLAKKLDPLEMAQYQKLGKVIDRFICVGSPLAKAANELIGVNPIVIPNVVNNLFQPANKTHKGFRFIAIGRLVKVKQFDKIIEAFAEIFFDTNDISLEIIGDGKEKESLQKLIVEKKLQGKVRLLGSQDREHTAKILSNCDNLICYSRFETFGVPIVEAWACGLTTITTTTAAAVLDNFDKRLGVEVSPDNFEGLKEAMRYVYKHRKEYDKQFIAKFAVEHFSEAVIMKELASQYNVNLHNI